MTAVTASPQPKRSEVVTIFAWINIALAILSALAGAGLFALFTAFDPTDDLLKLMHDLKGAAPPSAEFAAHHLRAIFGAMAGLSIVILITSIALLKRRNWARLFWIGCMALLVVEGIAGLFFQPDYSGLMTAMLNAIAPMPDNAPPEAMQQYQQAIDEMKHSMETVKYSSYIMSVVQAGLFAYGIWYFRRADIRREFGAA